MTSLPAALARSRVLRGRAVRALPVPGGTSNRAFRLEADGEAWCLRVPRPGASRGVDRAREAQAAQAAAEAGLGAPVAEVLDVGPEGPLLLLGWVVGEPLAPADLADPATLAAAGRLVRRLHAGRPLAGPPADYAAFLAAYRADAADAGLAVPDALDAGAPLLARIAQALSGRPDGLAPCHDDLVAANVLRAADGSLVLLDFEFAAQNDPWLDVGTLWSLNGLDADALGRLCAAYAGGAAPADRVDRAHLWAVVAHAAFALWALLQARASDAPVDFAAWAAADAARVGAWLDDPALGARLDRVARPGRAMRVGGRIGATAPAPVYPPAPSGPCPRR